MYKFYFQIQCPDHFNLSRSPPFSSYSFKAKAFILFQASVNGFAAEIIFLIGGFFPEILNFFRMAFFCTFEATPSTCEFTRTWCEYTGIAESHILNSRQVQK